MPAPIVTITVPHGIEVKIIRQDPAAPGPVPEIGPIIGNVFENNFSCEKCGRGFGTNKRARGQHQRWCDGTAAPAGEEQVVVEKKQSTIEKFNVEERTDAQGFSHWDCPFCSKPHGTRAGCGIHIGRCPKNPDRKVWSRGKNKPTIVSSGSECCGATVHVGERHALGNRYCDSCGDACRWKTVLGEQWTTWKCKTPGCTRKVEYKDGACLPCWEKERPVRVAAAREASEGEKELLDEIRGSPTDEI